MPTATPVQQLTPVAGAVLGLAGPGNRISGIIPCTVLKPGDMADRILSRETHPEWNGERMKMVYAFPSRADLWDRYAELRAESLRTEGRGRTVDEWKLPAHKPDTTACEHSEQTGREAAGRVPKGRDAAGARNHWFDCVVGCAAAASVQGVERMGAAVKPAGERRRLRLSDLCRSRAAHRPLRR